MPKKTTQTKPSVAQEIEKMIQGGECTVTEAKGKTVFHIVPTKVGQKNGKTDTIERLNREIVEGEILSSVKRIYRKKDIQPDPDQDHRAEVNRLTKLFQARVSPEHLNTFNRVIEKFPDDFPNKRAAAERAVEMLAEHYGIDFDS